MDRWIDIVMSARRPMIEIYFDDRARYGICFGLLYFLFGAVAVDIVLQKFWPLAIELPDRKISSLEIYHEVKVDQKRYASSTLMRRTCTDKLEFAQQALSQCTDGAIHLSVCHIWCSDNPPLGLCYRP